MGNETGESNLDNQSLVTEGLSGIKSSIENDIYLYVDGTPTSFSSGKGTQREPLIPLSNVHVRDALENAQDIAVLLKEYDLKRTIFLRHNDRLFGVDSKARVQLVKDGKWSTEDLKHEVTLLERVLSGLKEREKARKDSGRWTFRVVDPE